ncbi:hypothetical protein GALMADRAFT_813539 [Galerina marginata CBS 339.88]|uniref:Uncharacterized protein n=1 Tax=Galerina marginata (strain CBS 339.88) TaxID=685588 RepID=A0A067SW16_GALM3|nr:hypothetical protein GALMADRAFT_813539 [Galerina marginata CBS 339.88]
MPDNTSSRKFVDLIKRATAKWASWDPGHEIKVGDYGKIDKISGVFDRRGNIYDDTHIYTDKEIAQRVKDNPPKLASRENKYIATSSKVKRSDLKVEAEAEVPGLANASIKGQWTFSSERGALLIMAQPCSSYIPPAKLLEHLAKVKALEDMFLVTEVFLCPAYSLYLSSGNNDVVSLALVGSSPVPTAPGLTVGGELGVKWWDKNTTGLLRNGRDHHGKDSFTPLYMLKEIRKRSWHDFRRGLPTPVYEGDDLWCDVQAPWDPLDEEGNEDIIEDTIFE